VPGGREKQKPHGRHAFGRPQEGKMFKGGGRPGSAFAVGGKCHSEGRSKKRNINPLGFLEGETSDRKLRRTGSKKGRAAILFHVGGGGSMGGRAKKKPPRGGPSTQGGKGGWNKRLTVPARRNCLAKGEPKGENLRKK